MWNSELPAKMLCHTKKFFSLFNILNVIDLKFYNWLIEVPCVNSGDLLLPLSLGCKNVLRFSSKFAVILCLPDMCWKQLYVWIYIYISLPKDQEWWRKVYNWSVLYIRCLPVINYLSYPQNRCNFYSYV